jgi:hypothetical protein
MAAQPPLVNAQHDRPPPVGMNPITAKKNTQVMYMKHFVIE